MKDKNIYWQSLVDKHLVGRTIVKVEWLNPKDTKRLLGWDYQPCELHLDNGTIITPSKDDEGNDGGALWIANSKGKADLIPVIRV